MKFNSALELYYIKIDPSYTSDFVTLTYFIFAVAF